MKTWSNGNPVKSTAQRLGLIGGVLVGGILAQSPGDQLPLKTAHPGYTLSSMIPPGLEPEVTGMDFLSDGRLVVSTWGGSHAKLTPPSQNGNVYIFDNINQDDNTKVTYKTFATKLQEPLGLKIVNDTIYVTERTALSMLVDKDKDGLMDADGYRKVSTFTTGSLRHEFFFGLVYKDGFFYGAQSLSLNSGASFVPQVSANRGTFVKIEKATGKSEYIAGGAREPFGIGINPRGEILSTEVQGSWNPACALTMVKPGRFYGHPLVSQVPASPFDAMPYQPPAVLLPESEIANAPGQPVYIDNGIFKDQYFYGDVYYGGIQRVFLEKINGEYQGVVFRFSAGFTSGVSRLAFAPNGDLFVGEIGDAGGGNWLESGKGTFGLHKLKANGKTAFEMLTVRSRPKGMEIEFTEPVAADANLVTNYQVKSWHYTRTADYGGNKIDAKTLTVTSAQVSPDKKKVYLEVQGLEKDRLVYIRLTGLKSAAAKAPWTTEAWYTLNEFGSGNPFDPTTEIKSSADKLTNRDLAITRIGGLANFQVDVDLDYSMQIIDASGVIRKTYSGHGAGSHSLNISEMARGRYLVTLKVGRQRVTQPLALF
jgi:hypothetical protein